ncbi:hypothetical protein H4Q26_012139 [Puccinia striiformis f. sp. tritici PST-130]|nr:hypothetical protein H4Q26_012139 [Puccinia striiformis f. sp. tritici PST-130]
MPPPRFAQKEHLSYRNLLAIPAKKEVQFSEIPVLTTGSDSEDLIVATSQYWITKHTPRPGKLANKTVSLSACSGSISDFTACPFDQLLAVASESDLDFLPSRKAQSAWRYTIFQLRGILAGSIGSQLAIWDAEHLNDGSPSINLTSGTRMWDIKWSWDGRLLGGTTRTGILQLWDPRDSTMVASCDNQDGSGGRKCSRIAWIGDHILTTSVNKLRDRQYSVYDPRSLTSPIKTERIDNSNGTLIPLVDPNRSILYLATRGESTFKWLKLNFSNTLTAEAFNSMLPVAPIAGIAMAPINHQTVDVMRPSFVIYVWVGTSIYFRAAQIGQEWLQGRTKCCTAIAGPAASGGAKSFLKSTSDSATLQPTQAALPAQISPASQLPTTGPASYGVKKPVEPKLSDPVPSQSAKSPSLSRVMLVNRYDGLGNMLMVKLLCKLNTRTYTIFRRHFR